MIRIISFVFLLSVSIGNIYAQQFGLGVLLDDGLYKDSPKSPPLMRGDYDKLPESFSLKQYCPTPGYQGPYSTCAAWAVAYGGRTILEAMKYQWDRKYIDDNTFSPSYIYNQVRKSNGCYGGISLIDALDVLKDQGDMKMNDFAYDCDRDVKDQDKSKAGDYKIIEYREIFDRFGKNKSLLARKSLSESKPVVVAMDCPQSFFSAKELWTPGKDEYKEWSQGHGMIVIGYDDNKFGGAFEIMNSWGTSWGKGGFFWIKYADFDYFIKFGFEIIDRRKEDPNEYDISGKLLFNGKDNVAMQPEYNGNYFVMKQPYHSGDQFRLVVSNEQPAYVYAIGSDLSFSSTKIFPFEEHINPYLPYRENNIVLPAEDYYFQLDNNAGTSYFCFLYSKKSLNIEEIINNISSSEGTFWERLNKALGEDVISNKDFNIDDKGQLSFKSKSSGKNVLPVLVEIKHEKNIVHKNK